MGEKISKNSMKGGCRRSNICIKNQYAQQEQKENDTSYIIVIGDREGEDM